MPPSFPTSSCRDLCMHVMGGVLDANLHALFCTDTHTLRFNCVSAAEESPTYNLSLFLSLFFCLSLSLFLSLSLSLSLDRGAEGRPGDAREHPAPPQGTQGMPRERKRKRHVARERRGAERQTLVFVTRERQRERERKRKRHVARERGNAERQTLVFVTRKPIRPGRG